MSAASAPPCAALAVAVEVEPWRATLAWPDVPDALYYFVEYRAGKFPMMVRVGRGNGSMASAQMTGLVPGGEYRASVCAARVEGGCPGHDPSRGCTTEVVVRVPTAYDGVDVTGPDRAQCTVERGIAYTLVSPGVPLDEARPAGDAEECCRLCAATRPSLPYHDACRVFAYDERTRLCTFARERQDPRAVPSISSGRVVAWPKSHGADIRDPEMAWRGTEIGPAVISGQAAAGVPAAPEDGGPRNWKVTSALKLREQPSATARVFATYAAGTLLDNLGCQRAGGRVWCDVQRFGGGPRGYVAAEFLEPAVSPDGRVAVGPDDSALRAGEGRFDATGKVPCAQAPGQPMGQCQFGVARAGGGDATVVVTRPDGRTRALFFRRGRPTGADTSQADRGEFTATREGDLNVIRVGKERYEIPDAVVLGG